MASLATEGLSQLSETTTPTATSLAFNGDEEAGPRRWARKIAMSSPIGARM